MNIIRMEKWRQSKDNPKKMEYAGQKTAQEVFDELEQRLNSKGMLPDENFSLWFDWRNDREIPKDADITCTVDYGANEGIYLDVYLKWRADGRTVTELFIIGKTLGEMGSDLDRMFLIASEITKAFHGERGMYARYILVGLESGTRDVLLHLNPEEQRVLSDALAAKCVNLSVEEDLPEKLLRRVTSSITGYLNKAGQWPSTISAVDQALLAIRDGNLDAFKEIWPKAMDQADNLLVAAAGYAGDAGDVMCELLLTDPRRFSPAGYAAACDCTHRIGAMKRKKYILERQALLNHCE